MNLTENQISKLVYFLKSREIDDPYLLAEMTDHYGEKAQEEMKKGKSLEEVMDGWRTKTMFRTFRQIQANYTKYAEVYWKNKRVEMLKSLFTFKNSILIIGGGVLLIFLLQLKFVGVVVTYGTLVLSTLVFAILFYQITFSKIKGRLFPQYVFGSLGILLFTMAHLSYRILEASGYYFETLSWARSLLIAAPLTTAIVCLCLLYKIRKFIAENSKHITREMLIEWQVPTAD